MPKLSPLQPLAPLATLIFVPRCTQASTALLSVPRLPLGAHTWAWVAAGPVWLLGPYGCYEQRMYKHEHMKEHVLPS